MILVWQITTLLHRKQITSSQQKTFLYQKQPFDQDTTSFIKAPPHQVLEYSIPLHLITKNFNLNIPNYPFFLTNPQSLTP
jgi:hypothetical protein